MAGCWLEKTAFGMALPGELRRRERTQRVVITTHHTLSGSVSLDRRSALQRRLETILAELAAASAALDLRRLTGDFAEVVLNSEQPPRLGRVTPNVDGMGVVHPDGTPATQALNFTDLLGRDRRRWTGVMVHCHPRPGLLAMDERLPEASRWLQR